MDYGKPMTKAKTKTKKKMAKTKTKKKMAQY